MSQEAESDSSAPSAPPKGHFWRGPITSEKQAKDIIEWSACANLMFLMFAFAMSYSINAGRIEYPAREIGVPLFVGAPSPFLWLLRSRIAIILQAAIHGLLVFIFISVQAHSDVVAAKVILGSIFFILLVLDWRGFRATLAWQRLKKGRRTALAAVFE